MSVSISNRALRARPLYCLPLRLRLAALETTVSASRNRSGGAGLRALSLRSERGVGNTILNEYICKY
jgi:hypothetical protein